MEKDDSLGAYCAVSARDVLKRLKTNPQGLSSTQARERLALHGWNTLSQKKKSVILELLSQFRSPLLWILICASIVSLFFGQVVNAAIILLMVLLGAGLNFYQVYTASKAVEKLKESIKTVSTVVRDGAEKQIPIDHVTVGDIVVLSPGSLVPADCRVLESKELFVNQASLTGESLPAEKTHLSHKVGSSALGDLKNIVFMGTSVASGSARAVVFRVASETELGKISADMAAEPLPTDFERGVTSFSFLIMKTVLTLVLALFLLNSILKQDILQSLLFALAIAVGLTPELLPAIMSLNMAKGSLDMAKKGAIVKKLASIPNFGSMDVLCTDKTGTLTEDKIKLVMYVGPDGKDNFEVLHYAYLNSAYHTGLPNPLDSAVLGYKQAAVKGYKKIDEIPFDFVRRKMSVVAEKKGKRILITKGAPEEIFKSCTRVSKNAVTEYRKLSAEGYRVLGVAVRDVGRKKHYSKSDEHHMRFLGFAVFLDPPKKDVPNVLKELSKMKIQVKILTGDNELVTQKICQEVGLPVAGVLLGGEISHLSDEALRVKVENTTIFARVSPQQKNRIINALRANKHVVGYLGDGINDAPSLNAADVGISVNSAVDIAKESADIVLTHKSLEALRNGVIEGRNTFANTIKYITMGLSSNFGNMFSVLGAVVYVPFLPMLPMQILLNNLLYDFSQVTIPTDKVDKELVLAPRRWNMDFIKKFMFVFGPISSVFDLLTYYLMYGVFHASAAVFQTGWFIESLATQTLVIHVIRTKKVPFLQSMASPFLLISTFACVIIGWLIPYTSVGRFFGFAPLPTKVLLAIAGLVVVYLVTVELVKRWFYSKFDV